MKLSQAIWATHEGKDVWLFSVSNAHTEVKFTNYGCIVTAIRLVTENGIRNVVLGYNSFEDYASDSFYMGCIVGRFANRIADASFNIDGYAYPLSMNEKELNNHVHGGFEGFNRKVFHVTDIREDASLIAVRMEYRSEHMEEGYPGRVDVAITYELKATGEFTMYFGAQADRPTHVNLTSHIYFNLCGKDDISNHALSIDSSEYLQSNERFLPTGKRLRVHKSIYDFRILRKIMKYTTGSEPLYNTYFLLQNSSPNLPVVLSNGDGVSIGMSSSLPGVLLYTGDYLKTPFIKRGGVCLEFQFPPDAPNHEEFPSTLIKPGDVYDHFVRYSFST